MAIISKLLRYRALMLPADIRAEGIAGLYKGLFANLLRYLLLRLPLLLLSLLLAVPGCKHTD